MSSWSYRGVQTSFNGISKYLSEKDIIPKGLDRNQRILFMGKVLRDFLRFKGVPFDKRKTFYAIDKNAKTAQKHFGEFATFVKELNKEEP